MSFIYPGNLKERKTFLFLSVMDLAVAGGLLIICIVYAAKNFSLMPISLPATFVILKIRILENNSNVWEQLLTMFDYIVYSQQIFFWGERR